MNQLLFCIKNISSLIDELFNLHKDLFTKLDEVTVGMDRSGSIVIKNYIKCMYIEKMTLEILSFINVAIEKGLIMKEFKELIVNCYILSNVKNKLSEIEAKGYLYNVSNLTSICDLSFCEKARIDSILYTMPFTIDFADKEFIYESLLLPASYLRDLKLEKGDESVDCCKYKELVLETSSSLGLLP